MHDETKRSTDTDQASTRVLWLLGLGLFAVSAFTTWKWGFGLFIF